MKHKQKCQVSPKLSRFEALMRGSVCASAAAPAPESATEGLCGRLCPWLFLCL